MLADLFSLETKPETLELMLYALIPVIIALVVFYIGLRIEDNGGSKKIKWYSFIPLVIGLILNFKFLSAVNDTTYVAANWPIGGKKEMIMHYFAFFAPIIGMIIVGIWSLVHKRTQHVDY